MSPAVPNRFFYWPKWEDHATELSLQELRDHEQLYMHYLFGVLAEADRLLGPQGLQFLVTAHLDRFDERFRGAVALLFEDQRNQVPVWSPEVTAIFKTGGIRGGSLRATLDLPPGIAWRVAARDLRNATLSFRRRRHRARGTSAPIYFLPLGPGPLVHVPFIPFSQRPIDVFFAGSVGTGGFSPRPKLAARRRMHTALQQLEGQYVTDTLTFNKFVADAPLSPDQHATRMMRARVVLCPRGVHDETWRSFEATWCGCVCITERLPARWYYGDAPFIQIRDWSELPSVLRDLFSDEARMQCLSDSARDWWRTTVSEPAVANYVYERLAPELKPR